MRGHHLLIASAPPHSLCIVRGIATLPCVLPCAGSADAYGFGCHVSLPQVLCPDTCPHDTPSHVHVPVSTHMPSLGQHALYDT